MRFQPSQPDYSAIAVVKAWQVIMADKFNILNQIDRIDYFNQQRVTSSLILNALLFFKKKAYFLTKCRGLDKG